MKLPFVFIWIFWTTIAVGQSPLPENWDEPRDNQTLRIVFYNVENLFDTINDPLKRDEEFLPEAERRWNGYKYWDKLNRLSKVIANTGGWQLPDVVGVCEIENDTVLQDLMAKDALRKGDFQSIHFDSPDARGIDVGLLYNTSRLTLIYREALGVTIPSEPDFKTRDILYTKLAFKKDTLHCFINHWPSRRGGAKASEYKRIRAANTLKAKIDSLQNKDKTANIIVMGDFNDEPTNASIKEHLLMPGSGQLIDLMEPLPSTYGTHKYQGHWSYLDQFIITSHLLSDAGNARSFVFWQEWMLEKDSKHPGYYPKRSWRGIYYHYGFSDHLPIILDLKFSK